IILAGLLPEDELRDLAKRLPLIVVGRRVAGLAVVVSEMDEELIGEIERSRIPTVFYDVGTPGPHISNIRVNYRSGIERAVGYLYGLGHRRYGFVGHHSALGPTSERERAFVETLAHYGSAAQYRSAADEDRLDGGRNAARKLLDGSYMPTAIICVNDLMAVGVLRELRDRGLRVPEDVSVTGFDNVKLSEYCSPALTTLHIPRDRIGSLAAELLVPAQSKTALAHAEVVIDPELVIRESTGPAPA
ncbi:MAG TPA: LacI family transcriptional regulator, partial [Solibacterales bacterium]|nr:LacI family transcriptional regulator [Bryobacterales bacterium]